MQMKRDVELTDLKFMEIFLFSDLYSLNHPVDQQVPALGPG